jgi:hypothetical protein
MGTPEKRRRLTEEVVETSISTSTVTSTPSRPPLKKRFTSCVNVQQVQLPPSPAITTEVEQIVSSPPVSKYVETEISVEKY